MATGRRTKQMDTEFIPIWTVQDMKENGWMIFNMVREMNHGPMAVNMKENINKDKNMVMEHIIGQMEPHIVGTGVRIK